MRKLGDNQIGVLRALVEKGSYPGGWEWENRSTTVRILESLVKRGFVETYEVEAWYQKVTYYRITDAGRTAYQGTKTARRSG